MAAVPKKAQNYIPISQQNKNRMKFAAEPRRIKTRQGNLSYIEDRRIQKIPSGPAAGTARKVGVQGTAAYYARPEHTSPRPVAPRNMQAARISPQGEIAIPLPRTKIQKQPRQEARTAARPAGVVSTILLIAVVFGILSFLLARNAAITNLSLGNAAIQDRIEDLSQEINQLKLDITLKEDLGAIQERAAELNMSAPSNDQISYLPEENGAAARAPANQDTQDADLKEQPFSLDGLFKTIKSWLE